MLYWGRITLHTDSELNYQVALKSPMRHEQSLLAHLWQNSLGLHLFTVYQNFTHSPHCCAGFYAFPVGVGPEFIKRVSSSIKTNYSVTISWSNSACLVGATRHILDEFSSASFPIFLSFPEKCHVATEWLLNLDFKACSNLFNFKQ